MSDSVECIQDGGVCLLGECHSSCSQWQRRPGALLPLLQPSDVLRCMWRRTQLHQYPVLFCVVFDQGRRAPVHAVAKSVPVLNKQVHCILQRCAYFTSICCELGWRGSNSIRKV